MVSLIVVFGTGKREMCCSCCGCPFWRQLGQGDWDIQSVLGLSGAVLSVIYHPAALPVLLGLRQPRAVPSTAGWAKNVSLVTRRAELSPASSRESWPGTVDVTVLPEQGQPCSMPCSSQPASPVHSQALEHWSLGGIFCPISGLFGQGWSEKERQRHPYANREELLLQSSFQIMP